MKKDKIIFVHGAWHGKWCWDIYFRNLFEDAGYSVTTFDLPGHETPGKVKGINTFSIRDYTQALHEEVAKHDELPILIGHSMGGLIVQKYLETKSCKKAILLTPAPPHGIWRATLKFTKKGYFYPSILGLNLYGLVNSEEKSKAAFFSSSLPGKELKEFTEKMCSESFLAFLGMLFPAVRVKYHTQVPMLVLGAENDTIFSRKDNEVTAKKYGADLIMLSDMPHDVMLDVQHKKAAQEILNWLSKKTAKNRVPKGL